jgi:hypothetical protein
VQFLFYHAQGFLGTVSYPAHVDNLLHLCSNCHGSFDSAIPGIVIIPTDVNFFIAWEEKDYTARCQAANEGQAIPRTVPSSKDYTGTYRAYVLKDSFPIDDKTLKSKRWGGSPTAVILKACMGLFQPVVPDVDVGAIDHLPEISPRTKRNLSNHLPSGIRVEFAKLIELYSRPVPVGRATEEQSSSPLSSPPDSDKGDDPKDKDGPKENERRLRSNSRSQTSRQPKGKANTKKGKANTNKGKANTNRGKANTNKGKANTNKGKANTNKGNANTTKGKADTTKSDASITKGSANTNKGEGRTCSNDVVRPWLSTLANANTNEHLAPPLEHTNITTSPVQDHNRLDTNDYLMSIQEEDWGLGPWMTANGVIERVRPGILRSMGQVI